jgi:hypothetical protein
MKKAIRYAYPTSQIATDLGFKNGCYYVTRDEVDPLKGDAHIVCGGDNLAEVKHMASVCEGEWFDYHGKVQDGRNFRGTETGVF